MSTLQVAKTGLIAFQKASQLTSHNIANVNTEGFVKSRAKFTELPSIGIPPIGTGVKFGSELADFMLDQLDNNILDQINDVEYEQGIKDALNLLDPNGIPNIVQDLAGFHNAAKELMDDPNNLSVKQNFIGKAEQFTASINNFNQILNNTITSINTSLQAIEDSDEPGAEGYAAGLKKARDDLIPQLSNLLNNSTSRYMDRVNAEYVKGNNTPLFNLNGASYYVIPEDGIQVNAGTQPDANDVALGIVGLLDQTNNQTTIKSELLQSELTYNNMKNNNAGSLEREEFFLKHLQDERKDKYGVNLDEEAVNLLQYKRSYEAMAKVIQADNAMFQSLLAVV